jgi:hypothetical protein
LGNGRSSELDDRVRNCAGVRINPVALSFEAPGYVKLPDPIQGELGKELSDGLSTVSFVGPSIMKIEEEAAIRPFDNTGEEVAITQFVRVGS